MEEKRMLRIKAGKAKHFHAVQKKQKKHHKKAHKKTAARLAAHTRSKKYAALKLAKLTKHAARIQAKWSKFKKAHTSKCAGIKTKFTKRMAKLSKANAANNAK